MRKAIGMDDLKRFAVRPPSPARPESSSVSPRQEKQFLLPLRSGARPVQMTAHRNRTSRGRGRGSWSDYDLTHDYYEELPAVAHYESSSSDDDY